MSLDDVPALDLVPLMEHIATALASVRDEAALVAAMGDIMQRIIDVEYVAVFFHDRTRGRLRHVFAKGFTEEERREAERTAMDRHVGDVFRSQSLLHVPEVAAESDPSAKLSPRRHPVLSRLTLPIVGRGESVGAISLGSTRAHSFSQTHITLLRSVASLAGVVYWNLEDLKSLEVQLEVTRAQQEELRTLSTPLLEIAPGVLLLPLVGRMDAARADQIADRLLSVINEREMRAALIDVTGVENMDAASVSALAAITRATKLMGATCMLSGLSPASAIQMTEHDIRLDGISTFSSASNALVAALRTTR